MAKINKGLIVFMVSGLMVAVIVFGAYKMGESSGDYSGYIRGYNTSREVMSGSIYRSGMDQGYKNGWIEGNATGFAAGYQAGLGNKTIP